MTGRPVIALAAVAALVVAISADGQAPPAAPLTLVAKDSRRTLPTEISAGQDMVALDDLANAFQVTVREDSATNAVLVSYKGKIIVLTPDQTLATVGARLVSMSAPLTRSGRRWLVPVDFINRALTLIYDQPLDVRRASRLVVIGEARVPRVTARYEVSSSLVRVTLDVQPKTNHAVSLDGSRVLVKFDAEALDLTLPPLPQQPFATGVHTSDPVNTIAIDVGPRYGSYRTTTTPVDPAVRIAIDLLPAETEPVPAPGTPAPPGTPTPPPVPDPPSFGQSASSIRTIVLDPGHGGEEQGARGPGGTLEKDVTLSVARRLKATIESRLGIRVLLTREDDRAVGLDERAAIANNNKADLFLSLHANASVRATNKGAEIYYLNLDKSADAARRQANAEGQTLAVFGGGNRDVEIVLWELAQARFIDLSARLALLVEERLRPSVEMSPRAIQQAPFRVLVGANMPAVLVEIGYITNPEQEQQLASAAFQASLVQALYDSVVRFREYLDQRAAPATNGRTPDHP